MMQKQRLKTAVLFICLIMSFFAVCNLASATPVEKEQSAMQTLAADKVYVMYVESCPMCAKALAYINKNYRDNPYLVPVNLETRQGRMLLQQCRRKFGFKDVIIPLICAKDEYSMGWSASKGEKLKSMLEKITSSQD